MTTSAATMECVAVGPIAAMIAEYGALDMGSKYFAAHGFTHAVLPIGNADWDTEFTTTAKDAYDIADEIADLYLVKVCAI